MTIYFDANRRYWVKTRITWEEGASYLIAYLYQMNLVTGDYMKKAFFFFFFVMFNYQFN